MTHSTKDSCLKMEKPIWTEWLPDPVYSEVKEEEGKRFAALVQFLRVKWNEEKEKKWPEKFKTVLQGFPILFQFLDSKNDFDLGVVRELIELGLEIVFAARHDATVLVRYADAVSHLLRKNKNDWKGKLHFEWKPFYDLCMDLFVEDRFLYCGEDALSNIRQSVFCLVLNCSKYFPEKTFFEVWTMLKPTLFNVRNAETFISLGWLATFLPSQDLSESAGDWNALVVECSDLMQRVSLCDFWLTHWFDIFSRLAKYDTKGLISWNVHAPRLFTAFLGCFDLPIGTATGELKYSDACVPRRAHSWFPVDVLPLERSAAKCIIFMVRNDVTNAVVLPYVTKMIDLLEQFYHPSNGGAWTSMLASFMKHLVKQLMKVIARQDMIKEEKENLRIPKSVSTCLVEHLMKLASRGQFSKNKNMRSDACQAFKELAYLEPHLVIPLVYNRFVGAIESSHAPATLSSAMHAFAVCVRPMLMHGLSLLEMDGTDAALQAVARAMMDTLPGLDANDHAKTQTVFRFYAAVLFSIPSLDNSRATGLVLPLDVELWVEEYLSRIFVLLENMEGPEARTDQSHTTETTASSGTFLTKDIVFFDWCLEGVLLKLPAALQLRAIKRICSFLLSSPLPRSSEECEILCSALIHANEEATGRHLVVPLLQTLLEELPPLTGDKMNDTSFTRAFTTRVCWNLRLLAACLIRFGKMGLQHIKEVCEVVDRVSNLTNHEIQDMGGAELLKAVIGGLLSDQPLLSNDTMTEHLLSCGLVRWVARESENWSKPNWQDPNDQKIALANTMVDRYLTQSISQLERLMQSVDSDGQDAFEDRCYSYLNKIRGVLSATEHYLEDFEMPEAMQTRLASMRDVVSFSIAGTVNIKVGESGMRERLCETLVRLCPMLEDADPAILCNLLEAIDMTMNYGSVTPPDDFGHLSDPDEDASKAEMFFVEPPVAHPFVDEEKVKCLKRRPYYHALSRVWGHYSVRKGDASYLKRHSSAYPSMQTPDTVPFMMGELMGPVFRFSGHSYEEVADAAQQTLERLFRRFPALVNLYAPLILPSIIRAPLPEDLSMHSLLQDPEYEERIFHQLESVMQTLDIDTQPSRSEDTDMGAGLSQDAAVKGSVMLMSTSFHSWSGMFRVPKKTARMIYTFIGSRKNTEFDTQTFIIYLIWKFLSRFVSPPYVQLELPSPVVDQMRSLLADVGEEAVLGNWKFSLLANVLLLTVLPKDRSTSVDVLKHFFDISVSSLPPLRQISLRGLAAILQPVSHQEQFSSTPVAQLVKERLQDEVFMKRFLQVLIDDHTTASDNHANGDSLGSRARSMAASGSFEESLVNRGHVFVDRFGRWPEGEAPRSTTDGTFKRTHAETIYLLGRMAPLELCGALRSKLIELTSTMQDQSGEKSELSALGEIIAGFIGSAAPFVEDPASGSNAWDTWLAALLKEILGKCPLEYGVSAYAVALRYASQPLLKRTAEHRHFVKLVRVLLQHEELTGTGQSTANAKQLSFIRYVFKEISLAYVFASVPDDFLPLFDSALQKLDDALPILFQSIREVIGDSSVFFCSYILFSPIPESDVQRTAIARKAKELLETIVRRFYEGVQFIQTNTLDETESKEEQHGSSSKDVMEVEANGENKRQDLDLSDLHSKIGVGVQFVTSAMHSPQMVCVTSTLVQLLPGVLQIQELGDARLKPLQLEAVSSFASMKYLSIEEGGIETVIAAIRDATLHKQWHTRGAALVFLQVFWFHHVHLLSKDQSATLKALIVQMLEDNKLEVKNAACSTLSGMTKGMPEEEQTVLRNHFLAQARKYYPNGRRKKKASAAEQTKKHACILGLKAFVLSHPYDIPPWMAEVLMAMIPAAHDASPIKTTVTKTLGDFRTTHENESHEALRHAFDEETWESIQAVGSQASYFT